MVKKYSLSQLGTTHQTAEVNAGETKRLFYLKIPSGYVGFIYKIANSWYPNTYLDFIVDGERVERLTMERNITNPLEYKPPIVAKHYVEVIVTNNDSDKHYFEFWIDGIAIELPEE